MLSNDFTSFLTWGLVRGEWIHLEHIHRKQWQQEKDDVIDDYLLFLGMEAKGSQVDSK